MAQVSSAGFEQMRMTPVYDAYAAVAPRVEDFPRLMDATGALLGSEYDWTEDVPGLVPDTLLVLADADSLPVSHAAEFFGLLGGGQGDAGWDGSGAVPARAGRRVLPLTGAGAPGNLLDSGRRRRALVHRREGLGLARPVVGVEAGDVHAACP